MDYMYCTFLTYNGRYRHLNVPMYMSKVGIHYPCLVSFFFIFFFQTRASWSEDMDYIEKMYMFGNFRYLCQREREGFEREFQERGRGSFKRERDESTQAEKVVSRLNR